MNHAVPSSLAKWRVHGTKRTVQAAVFLESKGCKAVFFLALKFFWLLGFICH